MLDNSNWLETMSSNLLKEVEIKNFRAISSMKIPLNRITVFVGRNNTGKTSVLESIGLLLTSFTDFKDVSGNNLLELIWNHRGDLKYLVNLNSVDASISGVLTDNTIIQTYIVRHVSKIGESLIQDDIKKTILEHMKKTSFSTIERDGTVIVTIANGNLESLGIIRYSYSIELAVKGNLRLDPVYVRVFKTRPLVEIIDNLSLEKFEYLIDRLSYMIPYFYDYRNRHFVFKYGERFEIVPWQAVGDGLRAILEHLVPVAIGAKFILVEEPELHMHPGYMLKYVQELLNTVKQFCVQYMMTTHSLEFLKYLLEEAMDKNMLDVINIVRLYRLNSGEVDYEALSGSEAYEEVEELHGDLRGI